MTQKSADILDLMRMIALRPQMYGTPQASHGLVLAFAIVVLTEELGGPPATNLRTAYRLVEEATFDVTRERSQGVERCDEIRTPESSVSYEAFTRHTDLFLDMLKSHVGRVSAKGRIKDEDND
jgi:hypothetical protein